MEDTIRVLDRAIDILQSFSFEEDEQSLTDICEKVHLPKTTVFRIINSLEARNVLRQNSENGKYKIGYEMIKFGAIAQNGNELSTIAKSTMTVVSAETKQTCNLYIRDRFERVCIAQVVGSEYVRRYSFLGAHYPLYCGAGKLLLAFEPESFRERYFSEVIFEKFTDNTVTDKETLCKEITAIREQKYALTLGERDPLTAMIAVPVFDFTGRVKAALTVSGPVFIFSESKVEEFLTVLKRESEKLSRKLGYM